MSKSPLRRKHLNLSTRYLMLTLPREERGAAAAEYAATMAAGVGFVAVLIALIKSEFGVWLLKQILKFFLGLIGVDIDV
jgi:Flp pilus assembly pilin Flp